MSNAAKFIACFAASSTALAAAPVAGPVSLKGAGASFPGPLYGKWIDEYKKIVPKVTITYDSVGSGAGIQKATDRSVDFGASDLPMTDEQLAKASGKIAHIPTAMGAVVITYKLRGIASGLKLSPDVIASIFGGEITQWNDPRLSKLNPRVKFPAEPISVIHRSDNSGTTAVFTDFLSKVSKTWHDSVGTGTSVKWPVGKEAKGNDGVSDFVTATDGAIGYVELSFAVQASLPQAIIRNQTGKFVWPTIESVTAAAAGALPSMPADFRVSLTDAPGENSYPIASLTYLLVYEDIPDKAKGEALAKFLRWAEHDGQGFCSPLWYAPLPPELIAKVDAKLKSFTSKGQKLLNN